MSLIHVVSQLVDPVFNLALNVLHFIFLWPGLAGPWTAKWAPTHLPGSQLPREGALSWCLSEWVLLFPLDCWETLTGKVKNLFWHLEEHQGCFWFFGNPEQYPEFEDWIFLVNNCGRRNREHDSLSVYTSLLINSQCHNPKEKKRFLFQILRLYLFPSSVAFSHSSDFLA